MGIKGQGAYLPAVNITSSTDSDNVRVLCEHFVENRAHVFPITVLVEVELDNVFEGEWFP